MFFTKQLTSDKPVVFEFTKEKIIHINTISLEKADDSKEPIDIFCENKRKKETFKICSLKKNTNETYSTTINLDLHSFKDKFELNLKTKVKNVKVNIIGFYEEEEDDEEDKEQHLKDKNAKNEKSNKNEKEKEKVKEVKKEEKKEVKKEEKIKEKKQKEEDKEKKKQKNEDKGIEDNDELNLKESEDDSNDSKSESKSDSNDNDELEDNGPSVSLIELLNKKRKEEPQEIKPMTLKNLAAPTK